jgi:hypothetical protein
MSLFLSGAHKLRYRCKNVIGSNKENFMRTRKTLAETVVKIARILGIVFILFLMKRYIFP